MKKLTSLWLLVLACAFFVLFGRPVCAAEKAESAEIIGHVYATDILATVNGVPIPSYSIDGKTAVAIDDLRYYGTSFMYEESTQSFYLSLVPDEPTDRGIETERNQPGSDSGKVIGNVLTTDILTKFNYSSLVNGYITVPSFAINERVCVAIEDLAYLIPGLTANWDEENRIIALISSSDYSNFSPPVLTERPPDLKFAEPASSGYNGPATFHYDGTQYALNFYYDWIEHSDSDYEPRINLFFSISNDSREYFINIGEYVAGTPSLSERYIYIYDVGKTVYIACFMWWGGGGDVVFAAVENDTVFIYTVFADMPLDKAVPRVIAIINLTEL